MNNEITLIDYLLMIGELTDEEVERIIRGDLN